MNKLLRFLNPLSAVFLLSLFTLSGLHAQSSYSVNQGTGFPAALSYAGQSTAGTSIIPGSISSNQWSSVQNINTLAPGMTFEFFGTPVTDFIVSANGVLTFTTSPTPAVPGNNAALPTASLPNNSIAAWWDEFTPSPPTGGNDEVYVRVLGSAPNREIVIDWWSYERGPQPSSFTYFSIVLVEGSNDIYVFEDYHGSGAGWSATVGVQQNASTAVVGNNNVTTLTTGFGSDEYYHFQPFTLAAQDAGIDDVSLVTTTCSGVGSNDVEVTVINNGTAAFGSDYEITLTATPPSGPNVVFGPRPISIASNPMPVGATYTETFTGVTPTIDGTYDLQATVALPGDGNTVNDNATESFDFVAPDTVPVNNTFGTSWAATDWEEGSAGSIGAPPTPGFADWIETDNGTWQTFFGSSDDLSYIEIDGFVDQEYLWNTRYFSLTTNNILEFDVGIFSGFGSSSPGNAFTGAVVNVYLSDDCGATLTQVATYDAAYMNANWASGSNFTESITIPSTFDNDEVLLYFMVDDNAAGTTPDFWLALDNIVIFEQSTQDAGVNAVSLVNASCTGNGVNDIEVEIANDGLTAFTSDVDVDITVTPPSGPTLTFPTETYDLATNGALAVGATATVTNAAWNFTPSALGTYTVEATVSLPSDGNAANDLGTATLDYNVVNVPYTNTFGTSWAATNWVEGTAGSIGAPPTPGFADWIETNNATWQTFFGSSDDLSYVEIDGFGDEEYLWNEQYIALTSNNILEFDVGIFDALGSSTAGNAFTGAVVNVYLSDDCGATLTQVATYDAAYMNANWASGSNFTESITIPSSFDNQEVQLYFMVDDDAATGGTPDFWLALDNIVIFEQSAQDVGATAVVLPGAPNCLAPGANQLEIDVTNDGLAAVASNFDVIAEITGPNSYVYNDTLTVDVTSPTFPAGNTRTLTFTDFTAADAGTYDLTVFTSLSGDGNTSNDTLTASFTRNAAVSLPYNNSFGSNYGSNGFAEGELPRPSVLTGTPYTDTFGDWEWTADTDFFSIFSGPDDGSIYIEIDGFNDHDFAHTTDYIELGSTPKMTFEAWTSTSDFTANPCNNCSDSDDSLAVFISTDCGATLQAVAVYDNTHMNANWTGATAGVESIDLTPWANQSIQVYFYGTDAGTNPTSDNHVFIDNLNIINVLANDLEVLDVIAPVTAREGSPSAPGAAEQVEVVIRNNAADPGSKSITLEYVLNGGSPVSQTFTTSIDSAELDTLTFTTTADLSTPGAYTFDITLTYGPDLDVSNNTYSETVNHIPNPAITINQNTTPFTSNIVYDFETANGTTLYTDNTIAVGGLDNWDFEKDAPNASDIAVGFTSAAHAGAIEPNITGNRSGFIGGLASSNDNIGNLILNVNMSNYSSMTDAIVMDFRYQLIGGESEAAEPDSFYVRGSNSDPWIPVSYFLNSTSTIVRDCTDYNITSILSNNGQTFSASTQFRWNFADDFGTLSSNGMALDDVTLRRLPPTQDMSATALISPSGGGNPTREFFSGAPSATTPVTIEVTNVGNGAVDDYEIRYRFDDGSGFSPWVRETINVALGTGAVTQHTFASTVDLTTGGPNFTFEIGATSLDAGSAFAVNDDNTADDELTGINVNASLVPNPPIDLSVNPFVQDFEDPAFPSVGGGGQTGDVFSFAGAPRFDYENPIGSGNFYTTVSSSSGSKAVSLGATSNGVTPDPINYLIFSANLSLYTTADNIQLSFDMEDGGEEPDPNDRLWIRGTEFDPWIQIADLEALAPTGFQTFTYDLNTILANNGQNFSATTQLRWGQEDNFTCCGSDGFTFDDITLTFIPQIQDLAVGQLLQPVIENRCATTTETVEVELDYLGNIPDNTTPAVTVSAVVTDPNSNTTNVSGSLNSNLTVGSSYNVTLTPTVDMTVPGSYTIDVTITYGNDDDATNDNSSFTVVNPVRASLPLVSTFDAGYTEWSEGSNNRPGNQTDLPLDVTFGDWIHTTNTSFHSYFSPPAAGHVYLELDGFNDYDFLFTNDIIALGNNPELTFEAGLFGSAFSNSASIGDIDPDDSVKIFVSTDCGGTMQEIAGWGGNYIQNNWEGLTTAPVETVDLTNTPVNGLNLANQDVIFYLYASDNGTDNTGGDAWIHIDNINIYNVVPQDLAVTALVAPTGGRSGGPSAPGPSETVTVTVQNNSTNDPGPKTFDLRYRINGGPITTETFTNVSGLGNFGDQTNLSFATTADLSTAGDYDFEVWVEYTGDVDISNDTTLATVSNVSLAPVTIDTSSTPFTSNVSYDFETANGSVLYTSPTQVVGGLTNWDYIHGPDANHAVAFTGGPHGSAATPINGTRSGYIGGLTGSGDHNGALVLNVNMSNYSSMSDAVVMDFNYQLVTGEIEAAENDSLFIRGSSSDPWIPVQRILNTTVTSVQPFQDIDLTGILNANSQTFSATTQIRFNQHDDFGPFASSGGSIIDDITIRRLPPTFDVAASALVSPSGSGSPVREFYTGAPSATTPVTVELDNVGSANVDYFAVSYRYDDGSGYTPWEADTVTASIPVGGSYQHTFSSTVDLSGGGNFDFEIQATALDVANARIDNNTADDTLTGITVNASLIPNPALTINQNTTAFTSNVVYDFETATIATVTPANGATEFQVGGLDEFDFENVNNAEIDFDGFGSATPITGSRSAFISGQSTAATESNLLLAINMSNYSAMNDAIELDFRFRDHGDEDQPLDAVWIRGSETDPWVQIHDIDMNGPTGTPQDVTAIDLTSALVGASQTFSATTQLRFGNEDSGGTMSSNNGTDGVSFDDITLRRVPIFNDVGVASLLSPASGRGLTANEQITVVIENFGNQTETSIPVSYTLDGGAPVNETWTGTLAAGDTVHYTFTAIEDLSSAPDTFTFTATTSLTGDTDPSNDGITNVQVINLPNPAVTLPYEEGFETVSLNINEQFDAGTPGLIGIPGTIDSRWDYTVSNGGRGEMLGVGETPQLSGGANGTNNALGLGAVNTTGGDPTNELTVTLNLTNYSIPADEIVLDFWWYDDGDEDDVDDRVQVRGSVNDPWVNLVDLATTSQDQTWTQVTGQSITAALNGASQSLSSTTQIKFSQQDNVGFGSADGIAYDEIAVRLVLADNARAEAVTPLKGREDYNSALTSSENLEVEFTNLGVNSISTIDLSYQVNGGGFNVTETANLSPSLTTNNSTNYTFTATEDFSAPGVYTIDFATDLTNDGDLADDTVSSSQVEQIANPAITLPFVEDFENMPANYQLEGETVIAPPGLTEWDLEQTQGSNTIFRNNPAGVNGSGGLEFDHTVFGLQPAMYATLHLNLSNYDTANGNVYIDFVLDHSGADDPQNENRLTIRTDEGDPYVLAFDYGANWTTFTTNNFDSINISEVLRNNNLQFSNTTQIRFGYRDDGTFDEMTIDDINVYFVADTFDASISAITGPNDRARELTAKDYDGTEQVSIEVLNLSNLTSLDSIPVRYRIDGGAWVDDTLAGSFTPNSTSTFTFATPIGASITTPGVYTLEVTTALPGDIDNSNDTATLTLTHLANPVNDLSTDFVEDFESTLGATSLQESFVGLFGATEFDLEGATADSRLRTTAGAGFYNSGSRAITLDKSPDGGGDVQTDLVLTLNLSTLDPATDGVVLDFSHMSHGDIDDPGDRVWVRGSDGDPWIQIYDLDANAPSNGVYYDAVGLSISDALLNASPAQSFSTSTQIRFGQEDNGEATSTTAGEGRSFDDITVRKLAPLDAKVVDATLPADGRLDHSTALTTSEDLTVEVVNDGANSLAPGSFDVAYELNGGAPVKIAYNGPALSFGDTGTHTFTGANAADLSAVQTHSIVFYTELTGDADLSDDTLAAQTVTQFPNPLVTNAVGVLHTDGFESMPVGYTLQEDKIGLPGANLYDFQTDGEGIARLRADAGFSNTGAFAITSDRFGGGTYNNELVLNLNLDNFDPANDVVTLDFSYVSHDDASDTEDRIQIRGSETDPWITVYDLDPSNVPAGTYQNVANLNLSQALTGATPAQNFSPTTQIRFGNRVNNVANSFSDFDGITFDDVEVRKLAANDAVALAVPSDVLLDGRNDFSTEPTATEPVELMIFNNGGLPITSITAAFRVDGGPWNTEVFSGLNIAAADTDTVVFTATADLSTIATYDLDFYVELPGDADLSSDTLSNYEVRHLDNPTITLPFSEGFESMPFTLDQRSNYLGVSGAVQFDWETDSENNGRLRAFVDPAVVKTGSFAASSDAAQGASATNYLVLNLDLSTYSTAADDILLDFSYMDHSDLSQTNDRVWVRGSEGDNWVEVYDLDPNSTSNGVYNDITDLDLSAALAGATPAQNFSNTTQIRFGNQTNDAILTATGDDGITFDDIVVRRKPDQDVGVTGITLANTSGRQFTSTGLTASETVQVTIENFGAQAANNFPVRFEVAGQPVVSETYTAGPIAPGGTDTYTFTTNADLSGAGTLYISAFTALATDGDASNDRFDSLEVNNLPNPALTLPYSEGFESVSTSINETRTQADGTLFGIPGTLDSRWDYNVNGSGTGEMKGVDAPATPDFSGGAKGSSNALGFGEATGNSPTNNLVVTLNLSNYDTSGNDIVLDYSWWDDGDENGFSDDDQVEIRGSETDSWVLLDNINPTTAELTWTDVTAVNMTSALVGANQNFSTSTQLRFRQTDSQGFDNVDGMAFDEITVREVLPDDIVASSSPMTGGRQGALGATETVSFYVRNDGSNPIDSVEASYSYTDGTTNFGPFTETFSPVSIAAGDSLLLSFTTTADLSATVTYTFEFACTAANDVVSSNDTLSGFTVVHSPNPPITLPYLEGFETVSTTYVANSDVTGIPGTIDLRWDFDTDDGSPGQIQGATGSTAGGADGTTNGMAMHEGSGNQPVNRLVGNLNLSNYDAATDNIFMDFWWYHNDDEASPGVGTEVVEIRGSSSDSWVQVYDLPNNGFGDGLDNQWNQETDFNLSQALQNASPPQNFSATTQIRFGQEDNVAWSGGDGMAFDEISLYQVFSNDVLVSDILTPGGNGRELTSKAYSATQSITVRVKNEGVATQSNIPVSFQVGALPKVTETIAGPLASGDSIDYTFTATADFSATGSYTLTAFTELGTEEDVADDTSSISFEHIANQPVTLPVSEGFESVPSAYELDDTLTGIAGAQAFDYENELPGEGRLRAEAGAGYYNGGSRAITLDRSSIGSEQTNYLIWTVNMDNYTTSDLVLLDVNYQNNGQDGPKTPNDNLIWVRGSDTDPWVSLYDLEANKPAAGSYSSVIDLDVSSALTALSQNFSSSFQVRFGQRDNTSTTSPSVGDGLTFDDLTLRLVSGVDLELNAIVAPQSGRQGTASQLTSTQQITVNVKNVGTAPQSNIPVYFDLNSSGAVMETIPGPIAPGDSLDYTFTATVDMSSTGTYNLTAYVAQSGDGDVTNDTLANQLVQHVPNTPITLPFKETFECQGPLTLTGQTFAITGLEAFDFSPSDANGRLRTNANTNFYLGDRGITLDRNSSGGVTTNFLVLNLNMANYDVATDNIILNYVLMHHGESASGNDRVWVRGNTTDPWVEIENLNAIMGAAGGFRYRPSINLTTALQNASQNFSAGTQIRFGQQGNNAATSTTASEGFSFDNIVVRQATDNTCEWTGFVDANFSNPGNWFNCSGLTPASGDNVLVTQDSCNPSGNYPNISTNLTVNALEIDSGASFTAQPGSNIDIQGPLLNAGTFSSFGTVTFSGTNSQDVNGDVDFNEVVVTNPVGLRLNDPVTVSGCMTLNGGPVVSNGNLTILSTSTKTGCIIGSGTITGDVTIQRHIPAGIRQSHLLSSPIGGPSSVLSQIDAPIGGADLVRFDPRNPPPPQNFPSAWFYVEDHNFPGLAGLSPLPGDSARDGWVSTTLPANPLNTMTGYAVEDPTGNVVYDFTGNYVTGTQTAPITFTPSAASVLADGANLVGNPYPSPIDFDAVYTANSANINPTNYVLISGIDNYGEYNAATGISTNGGTRFLAIAQGFWVVTNSNATLTMDNTMRVAQTGTQFFKTTQNYPVVKLGLTDVDTHTAEIAVFFKDSATTRRDIYDSPRLPFAGNVTLFYSMSPDGYEMIQNSQPADSLNTVIPLHTQIKKAGTHTVDIQELKNFEPGMAVILEDLKLGVFHDLRSGAYTYQADPSDSHRFNLYFNSPLDVSTQPATCEAENGALEMVQPGSIAWDYTLLDASGAQVASGQSFTGNHRFDNLPVGDYTLQLTHPTGYSYSKLVTVQGDQYVDVSFSANANRVAPNSPVEFTAQMNGATAYTWDFGDGNTMQNVPNPIHTYSEQGVYTVNLTGTNDNCATTYTMVVEVSDQALALEEELEEFGVTAYSHDEVLYVRFGRRFDDLPLVVRNMAGQDVYRTELFGRAGQQLELRIPNLSSGVYAVSFEDETVSLSKKLFLMSED